MEHSQLPNYRLGPLVLTESIESNAYLITPNPASLHFAYDNLDKPGVLRIYNQHGQQVLFQKLSPYYHIVYVNKLPIGMYFTSLEVSGKIYWDKIVENLASKIKVTFFIELSYDWRCCSNAFFVI